MNNDTISKDTYRKGIEYVNRHLDQAFECYYKHLSPKQFTNVRNILVEKHKVVPTDCYVSSEAWIQMLAKRSFIKCLEPVPKHELVLRGNIAALFGMKIWIDSYFHPEEQFMKPGEILFMDGKREVFSYVRLKDWGGKLRPLSSIEERL